MKKRNMFGLVVSIVMILASMMFAITPVSAQSPKTYRPTPTPDITAPTVSSTIPTNDSTGVAINSKIIATFSEMMRRSTITAVTFTLTQGATPISGKVTYSGGTATFRPAVKLAYSTNYTATITIGATDTAGNPLAVDYVWSFTTRAAPDTTAPTVISTIPVNGAPGVVINRDITATFNEAMDHSTITTATFTLTQGKRHVAGTVTYVGDTATFRPAVNLTANTTYTATITNRARDIAGNRLADRYVWSFTTDVAADTTAPSVISTTPANGAHGVAINSAINATFSEAMRFSTITGDTFTLTQGVTPVSGAVTYVGGTATFTPAGNLTPSTIYTATITTGVKDLAGNALEIDKVWSFITGAVPDTTAPTVISTIPLNTSIGVANNSKITATFSEAMNSSTIIATATFNLTQGGAPVAGTVNYTGVMATFTPTVNLAVNTTYNATITTGAKDLAGNALANNFTWRFTTGATSDTTAPTVNSTIPLNASIGVAISSAITANFSEAMDPLAVTNTTFTLTHGATSVNGTVILTPAGVTATFTPAINLAPSTNYTAMITIGAKDLAGNALASNYTWNFSTGATLPANPTAPVLGEAGRFVILASQKITTTGTTAISNGDIGIEDQARSYYEGFTAGANPGQFIELVNGLSYAHDDMPPFLIPAPYASTIAFINQVRTDLGIAYTFLAADPNPSAPTQVCPTELGGLTLTRGVYKTAVDVTIQTGDLHLDAQGDPDSVWIFSIGGTLTTGAPYGNIVLDNDAQAKNVYWRTAGTTVIGAGTSFQGNVFSWTQVNVLSGAGITGRLFAVTEQVTLIADTVTKAP